MVSRSYKWQKSSVLRRLIVSYIGIFILFLSFWIIIYGVMLYNTQKQTYALNEMSLSGLKNEMDKRVLAVNTTCVSLLWDNVINGNLINLYKESAGEAAYSIYEVKNQLETYRKSNIYISDIYIYLKENDYIISSNTAVTSKIFYELNHDILGASYEQWLSGISENFNFDYWSYDSGDGKEKIYLSHSIPIVKTTRVKGMQGTLVIMLNEGIFQKNALEFCNLNKVFLELNLKDLKLSYCANDIEKRYYKTISVNSETKGITYSVKIPKNIYMKQQKFLFIFLIICFAICMMIFLYLTVASIRRNYNPLRDLIIDIKTVINSKENSDMGEYVYLKNTFHKVMEQQLENEKCMNQQMEQLRESTLVQLLTGSLKWMDVHENEIEFLDDFLYSKYALILIKKVKDAEDNLNLDEIGIHQKKSQTKLQGIRVKIGKVYIVMVNVEELTNDEWKEYVYMVRNNISASYDGYNIAASSLHNVKQEIHKVYYEMVYILQCMETFGKVNGISYEENFERREFSWFTKEEEVRLINAIQSLDIENTNQILEDMWKNAAGNGGITIDEAKVLLIGQINILYKSTSEICPNLYRKGFPVKYHDIIQLENMEEIKEILLHSVRGMIEQVEKLTSTKEGELIVKLAIEYVDENYADMNLNVEKLCNNIGRSVSTVSKAFRELRGESILYYINYRRIQKAKDAINKSKGNILINNLYEKVGFGSINTFIRAFKKYEGITPGSYVEIVKSTK